MNFTLALLGGLVLIAPGLVALAFWQMRTGQDGVRRSELPLTSVIGLVVALTAAALAHFVGWALLEAGIVAGQEIGAAVPSIVVGPSPENPYAVMARLAEGAKDVPLDAIVGFVCTVGVECLFLGVLVNSRGLAIVASDIDISNQGWVFQQIVRPTRFGMKPIAYVLTQPTGSSTGLGYRGVIVEARQSSDGELKGITLSDPEVFGYEVAQATDSPAGSGVEGELRIRTTARRSLPGVINLEAATIRNVLVQTIADTVVDEIFEEIPGPDETAEAAEANAR